MKKVLYLSNIEVPYRVRMFNGLSKYCELTVLYELEKDKNRNEKWSKSVDHKFNTVILKGIKFGNENSFSLGILKHIFGKYDAIIVGCFNSPSQVIAILAMRLFKIPYILNIDGEVFLKDNSFKSKLKKFFLKGASAYLTAGEKCAESIKSITMDKKVYPYYFSSLSEKELYEHTQNSEKREETVLVAGQYLDVKGMDVALSAAKADSSIKYKFIGMGDKTREFIEKYSANNLKNVEFVPFLQKDKLENEYKKCSVFVLPSRQECWGLVINEAASFGTPIVSTYGSGAAVEFLEGEYSKYLAIPGDSTALLSCIKAVLRDMDINDYSKFLIKKSKNYSIENNIKIHLNALDIKN